MLNTVLRQVHEDEPITQVLEVLGPAPIPRSDLQDRARGDEGMNPWEQESEPHRVGSAPPPRPLVTLLRPPPATAPESLVLLDPGHVRNLVGRRVAQTVVVRMNNRLLSTRCDRAPGPLVVQAHLSDGSPRRRGAR